MIIVMILGIQMLIMMIINDNNNTTLITITLILLITIITTIVYLNNNNNHSNSNNTLAESGWGITLSGEQVKIIRKWIRTPGALNFAFKQTRQQSETQTTKQHNKHRFEIRFPTEWANKQTTKTHISRSSMFSSRISR